MEERRGSKKQRRENERRRYKRERHSEGKKRAKQMNAREGTEKRQFTEPYNVSKETRLSCNATLWLIVH